MGGDRLSLFLATAAPDGPLAKPTDPRDPAVWHRIAIAVGAADRAATVATAQADLAYCCAMLACGNMNAEDCTKTGDRAAALIHRIGKAMRPWAVEAPTPIAETMGTMEARWAAQYGDPNSPETLAMIERTKKFLEASGGGKARP